MSQRGTGRHIVDHVRLFGAYQYSIFLYITAKCLQLLDCMCQERYIMSSCGLLPKPLTQEGAKYFGPFAALPGGPFRVLKIWHAST